MTDGVIYFHMATIASLMIDDKTRKPFRTQRARRWLQKVGACRKIGGRWVTTPDLLLAHFPEFWQSRQRDLMDAEGY